MISVRDLSFGYPESLPLFSGLSFALPLGQTLGLAGANASGKSSLLAVLAGLFHPSAGSVCLADCDGRLAASVLRRSVRLVLQEAELQVIGATVGEDLCLTLEAKDRSGRERARELARRFALLDDWETPVQLLSYGQKRKLAIAGALLDRPQVLMFDEPFAGLDYPGACELRAILADLRARGQSMVVATHEVEPVADLVDVWLVLARGRQSLFGGPEQVFDRLIEYGVRPPCAWQDRRAIGRFEAE